MSREEICKRINAITKDEVANISYLYDELLLGLIQSVFDTARVPRENPIPTEYFEEFKYAFCEEMFSGCEPEFTSTKSFNYWNSLTSYNFKYIKQEDFSYESYGRTYYKVKCPYINKDIAFLYDIREIKNLNK